MCLRILVECQPAPVIMLRQHSTVLATTTMVLWEILLSGYFTRGAFNQFYRTLVQKSKYDVMRSTEVLRLNDLSCEVTRIPTCVLHVGVEQTPDPDTSGNRWAKSDPRHSTLLSAKVLISRKLFIPN